MDKEFDRETKLMRRILERYPSVRLFMRHIGFQPHKRITNTISYANEYLYVCDRLGVDPYTLEWMNRMESNGISITENKLLHAYMSLNANGRDKVMEILRDLNEMPKYRRKRDE